MTNNDEFDVDLELEENAADDFSDDAGFQEDEAPVKQKKSGGGFLVKFLLFLVLVAGGLFASVKYLGVQVPYLSEMLAGAPEPAAVISQNPAPATPVTTAVNVTDTDMSAPGAETQSVGEEIAWADAPDSAVGTETPAVDNGMDDFSAMTADGTTDTSTAPAAQAADDGGFGLPPTTDDATDLSALGAETTAPAATDVGDVWGDMPAATTGTDTADASAPFGDVETAAVPETTETPVVTSPVPDTTATADAPVDNKAVAALEEEVAALEKEVSTLEKSIADLKQTTVSKSDAAALKAALAAIEKTDSKPVVTDKTETAKPAATKSAPAVQKPVVRKSWVLRSAKPGMAWISEKGSNEIKTISVGDHVSGIGKVTDIATDDSGRWVVSGTRGKINQ